MLRESRRLKRRASLLVCLAGVALLGPACATLHHEPPPGPAPPRGEALPPEPGLANGDDPGPVKEVQGPIVVAAWAEPRQLPAGGGQAQVIVRVQKNGGARLSGVEVRLSTSAGALYSAGRVLMTDAQGMTRDRLTTHKPSVITLNAGGTRYRFQVNVGEPQ
jgi:hypothetical protein